MKIHSRQHRLGALALILLSAWGAAEEAAKTQASGGQASVDSFMGSFNYNYPIAVPRYHGLEPKLALQYTSNSKNGWVGVGWNLSGLSVIDRASPGRGAPNFDDKDIYLLDGQELVPCTTALLTTAPSCAAGGTHATKIESYLKIVQDKVANTWTLYAKNGTRTVFKPTFSGTKTVSACPAISITGGPTDALYFEGLTGAGSKMNFVLNPAPTDPYGPYANFTLTGFTASGGGYKGRGVTSITGNGNRLDFTAFHINACETCMDQVTNWTPPITLTGAVAYGRIFNAMYTPYYDPDVLKGIVTLYATGNKLTCRPLWRIGQGGVWGGKCWGEIEFFPNCGATKEIDVGPSRWGVAEVIDTHNNNVNYSWACERAQAPTSSSTGIAITATSTTANSVTLTWAKKTDPDLAFYRVYVATSSGQYGAPIATLPLTTTTHTVTNLAANTTYYFVVSAIDTQGNESGYTGEVSIKTGSTGSVSSTPPATGPMQDCYPSQIAYNGTVISLLREGRDDVVPFVSGAQLSAAAKRIAVIDISTGGQKVRAYDLGYGKSALTTRSLLTSINAYGSDATVIDSGATVNSLSVTGTAAPAVTFGYNNGGFTHSTGPQLSSAKSWIGSWCSGTMGTADFNGDGFMDMWCHTGSTTTVAWAKRGASGRIEFFSSPYTVKPSWCAAGVPFGTADFNGDGAADLWCRNGSNFTVSLGSRTSSFTDVPTISNSCIDGRSGLADVNGDGMLDMWCHNGSGVSVATFGAGRFNAWVSANSSFCATGLMATADFNGDGKADFACHYAGRTQVALSLGSTLAATQTWATNFCLPGTSTLGFADFNADGKADIYCHGGSSTFVGLSTGGASFVAPISDWRPNFCPSGSPFGTSDFDGDGASDLWCFVGGEFQVATSNLRSFNAPYPWNAGVAFCPAGSKVGTGDFTGDGRDDFWCKTSTGTSVGVSGTGEAVDLVSTVSTMGGTNTVTYRSSGFSNYEDYSSKSNNPPLFPTVANLRASDGVSGLVSDVAYEYTGGKYDRRERRFLGFFKVTQRAPRLPNELASPLVETYFKQDYGSIAQPLSIVKRRPDLGILSVATFGYETNAGAVPYYSRLISATAQSFDDIPNQSDSVGSVQTIYDFDGSRFYVMNAYDDSGDYYTYDVPYPCPSKGCRKTQTRYEYDLYGNQRAIFDDGDVAVAGDERTTTNYFPINTTKYIVGIPSETNVYKGVGTSGTKLNQTISFFDDAVSQTTPINIGNLTKTLKLVLPSGTYAQTSAKYDAWGNIKETTNEVGSVTRTVYDTTYNTFPISVTSFTGPNATGTPHTNKTSWNYACGAPAIATDVNGQVSSIYYDKLCREYKSTAPGGNFKLTSYVSFGDAKNQHVRTETPGATGNPNIVTRSYFNGLGQTYRTVSTGIAGVEIGSETQYNVRGLVARKSAPHYLTSTDPALFETFTYNAQNKPIKVTHSDASFETMSYFASSSIAKDEMGRRTDSYFDARGRVILKREWSSATTPVDTRFGYDDRDNPTTTTDAMGNITTVAFDSLGRKIQIVDPDTGTSTFAYDAAGALRKETDGRGFITTYDYDALGRLKTKTIGATTAQATAFTFEYDTAATGSYNMGRLVKEVMPVGTKSFRYDMAGRVVQESAVLGGTAYPFNYTYDVAGRLLSKSFPNGTTQGTPTLPLRYDAMGRLLVIPGIINDIQYNASGNPVTVAFANGIVTTRSYYPRQWLKSITTVTKATTTVPSKTLQQLVYARNLKGLKTGVTSPFAQEGWTYGYDGLDRLASATNTSNSAQNQTFKYDDIGNLITNSRRGTYTYPVAKSARPHAVSNIGSVAFQYDAAGNMKSGDGRTYTWDADGNLASVVGNGHTLQFAYDSNGERIRTIDNGVTSYSMGAYDVQAGVGTVQFSLGGTPIAEKAGSTLRFLHADGLDSVNVITDASGNEVQRINYRPLGEVLTRSTALASVLSYTGEKRDSTNLTYLHARYYDASLGRFVSPDSVVPSTSSTGFNRYAYANNDPINFTDRNGHDATISGGGDGSSIDLVGMISFAFDGAQLGQAVAGLASGLADFFGFGGGGGGAPAPAPPMVFHSTAGYSGISVASSGARSPLSFGQAVGQVAPQWASIMGEAALTMFGGTLFTGATRLLGAALNFDRIAAAGIGYGARFERHSLPLGRTWRWGLEGEIPADVGAYAGRYTDLPARVNTFYAFNTPELMATLRHEWVHSLFKTSSTGFFAEARAQANSWAYRNSALKHFTEEVLAESFGRKSFSQGWSYGFKSLEYYKFSTGQLAAEATGYFGVVGGASGYAAFGK